MSKADEFIRELHADLAPVSGESASDEFEMTGTRLTESERRQVEALAAASDLKLSRIIRASVRRTLREARKAGVLVAEKA
jgi:hypothetical protein